MPESRRSRGPLVGGWPTFCGGCPTLAFLARVGILRRPITAPAHPSFQSYRLLFVDYHGPVLFISVCAVTAPPPFFWRGHQSAPHRILVHVAQLLGALVPVPHDKIIEAPLPDMALLQHCVPRTSVRTGVFLSEPLQQFASERSVA